MDNENVELGLELGDPEHSQDLSLAASEPQNVPQVDVDTEEPENVPDVSLAAETEENVPAIELSIEVSDALWARRAEAWAVGTVSGEPVTSDDPTFHNNSKYYAQQAGSAQTAAESAQTAAETAQDLAEDAQEAAETAQTAAEAAAAVTAHPPYINTTTYTWMTWDSQTEQYVNSNIDAKGTDGEDAYVYIRYSAAQPTQDSDMKTTADAWMGIYSGDSATAPTTYTSYTWYQIKGAQGDGVPSVTSSDNDKILKVVNGVWAKADEATGLPTVTSSDNGKVLTVVSGDWAAAEAASGLPDVTSSDNGKFLRVVNGEWAATTVPNANGVSF